MGIRLFPGNELTPEQVERLLEVPAGTAALCAAYETLCAAMRETNKNGQADFPLYSLVSDFLPNVFKYWQFDVYGWGRLRGTIEQFVAAQGLPTGDAGRTTDIRQVHRILDLLNAPPVAYELVTAISWS